MNQKRRALQRVAGVGAVAALLPRSWTKPVVSAVFLPAHAQTSDTVVIRAMPVQGTFSKNVQLDGGPEFVSLDDEGVSPPFTNSILVFAFLNVDGNGVLSGIDLEVEVLVSSPFSASPVNVTIPVDDPREFSVNILDSTNKVIQTIFVQAQWSE